MAINPKIKVTLGVVAIGGGAYEFYNAYKSTGGKRIVHGLAGLGLFIGGILAVKNGRASIQTAKVVDSNAKRASLPPEPVPSYKVSKFEDNSGLVEIQKEYQSPETVIITNSNTGTPIVQYGNSAGTGSGGHRTKRKNGDSDMSQASGNNAPVKKRSLNKMDIDKANEEKRQINGRITELMIQLKILPKDHDGYETGKVIRNEIGLLKARLQVI